MSNCRAPLPSVNRALSLCFLTQLLHPLLLILLVLVPILKIAAKEYFLFHRDTVTISPSMFAMLTPLHSSSPYAAYVRPSSRFVCLHSTKVVFLRHGLCCVVSWLVFILCFSTSTVNFPPHESVQLAPTFSFSSSSSVLLVSASNLCSCQGELSILSDFYVATNGASWKNSDGWNGACTKRR